MRPVLFDPSDHSYFSEGEILPSVTRILMDEGFVNDRWFTEESRNRGSDIHLAIKHHYVGGCSIPPGIAGYFKGFLKFKVECNWKPEIIEEPMACDLYAGTPDQLGMMNSFRAILDIKSGAPSLVTALQTQGYKGLHPDYCNARRFALHLTAKGKYKLIEYTDRRDKYIWGSAVALWHYKRDVLKLFKERG